MCAYEQHIIMDYNSIEMAPSLAIMANMYLLVFALDLV